jgi:D-3-phosphoglycerate dehydrogenase / 2-oxoglutarate reductase
MPPVPWLLIDFDSTFVTVESLELLAEISLRDGFEAEERESRIEQIRDLTRLAMAGHLSFPEALERRFTLLEPRLEQLPELVNGLKRRISPSFQRHAGFIREHAGHVYIISAGFHEYIEPVVETYGITPGHVLANRLVTRPDGSLGFDPTCPLARDGGKVTAVRELNLHGPVIALGDGISDLELQLGGACDVFFAYTETVDRPEVSSRATCRAASFDTVVEFIEGKEFD